MVAPARHLLVDTHILVWALAVPGRLSAAERRALDMADVIFVSIVTLWEAAILMSLGRLEREERLIEPQEGFTLLPVTPRHCRELMDLPRRHRDPFDRMLIAQARADGLTLLTRDTAIAGYGEAGAATLVLG